MEKLDLGKNLIEDIKVIMEEIGADSINDAILFLLSVPDIGCNVHSIIDGL